MSTIAQLDALIDELTLDAYGDEEQLSARILTLDDRGTRAAALRRQ